MGRLRSISLLEKNYATCSQNRIGVHVEGHVVKTFTVDRETTSCLVGDASMYVK